MKSRPQDPTAEQLLHADTYTPEELSELTGVGIDVIRRAAYDGELHATIVETDIVSIPRSEASRWLGERSKIVAEET